MTKRKPDARFSCPPHEKRKHYACLLREFVFDAFKGEVERLNCSQGVYLEILLIKALESGLVTSEDVFEYDAQERSDGRMLNMDFPGVVQAGKADFYKKLAMRDRYAAVAESQLFSTTLPDNER
jgi:hypothetical protein